MIIYIYYIYYIYIIYIIYILYIYYKYIYYKYISLYITIYDDIYFFCPPQLAILGSKKVPPARSCCQPGPGIAGAKLQQSQDLILHLGGRAFPRTFIYGVMYIYIYIHVFNVIHQILMTLILLWIIHEISSINIYNYIYIYGLLTSKKCKSQLIGIRIPNFSPGWNKCDLGFLGFCRLIARRQGVFFWEKFISN